jgi:hypothetical protein
MSAMGCCPFAAAAGSSNWEKKTMKKRLTMCLWTAAADLCDSGCSDYYCYYCLRSMVAVVELAMTMKTKKRFA